ncbi:acetolactate decarboxylase [Allomuricauda sp. F6463D]|uniref:acetolactate decarboxylase n=1 Tax=Allomuricauda sp. F6463D TaxID=2926409 RepID=UPI001FF135F3|nr:acetolactate decarboxylase [Muricauda sp. F6463D]MCK0159211.1 acetolactate decarboxylase [Muricauda sp. F6463D]
MKIANKPSPGSRLLLILAIMFLFINCKEEKKVESNEVEEKKETLTKTENVFYQYSIWWAFVNKIFEGDLSAKELKTKGDIGLGSYNLLDGELIMLDGVLYQASEDGKVHKPEDDTKVVYANAAFFNKDYSYDIPKVQNYEELRAFINEKLPTKNFFYAFKIHGEFSKMKCGGLHKQEPPFEEGLDVLIPERPIFERENFKGTMVGFYCPTFIGNINVAGYHLHFVSDDEQFAGHVMEFEAENLTLEIDQLDKYQFDLPNTEDFENVGFDNEFQYKKD